MLMVSSNYLQYLDEDCLDQTAILIHFELLFCIFCSLASWASYFARLLESHQLTWTLRSWGSLSASRNLWLHKANQWLDESLVEAEIVCNFSWLISTCQQSRGIVFHHSPECWHQSSASEYPAEPGRPVRKLSPEQDDFGEVKSQPTAKDSKASFAASKFHWDHFVAKLAHRRCKGDGEHEGGADGSKGDNGGLSDKFSCCTEREIPSENWKSVFGVTSVTLEGS